MNLFAFNLFQGNFTESSSINSFINNIVTYAIDIIGIVCVIFVIWGGILLITAGGNQEQMTKGKNALTWAIIGLILVLGAKYIIDTFITVIKGK